MPMVWIKELHKDSGRYKLSRDIAICENGSIIVQMDSDTITMYDKYGAYIDDMTCDDEEYFDSNYDTMFKCHEYMTWLVRYDSRGLILVDIDKSDEVVEWNG